MIYFKKLLDFVKGLDMFQITYRELRSDEALRAVHKLTRCTELPPKVAYNVMRMSKAIDQELKESQRKWSELADKHIEKDFDEQKREKYKFVDGKPVFKEGTPEADGLKLIEDFNDTKTLIPRHKLKVEDLAPVKLSPAEMYAIEWMFEELPA